MRINCKKYFNRRIKQIYTIISVEGSLTARLKGYYFEMYELLLRVKKMGISPSTIIDVGANRGMFTKTAHYIFPDSKIIAFEPLPDCFKELKNLRASIHDLDCYNFALSNENGKLKIHHHEYDYSSSFLEMTNLHIKSFPYTEKYSPEEVIIKKLDDVIAIEDFDSPILLKIDVQGYEKNVLQGGIKTIQVVDYIICELSFQNLYKDQPLFGEIYKYLMEAGFKYLGPLSTNYSPFNNSPLQIDGLFFNSKLQSLK